MRAVAFCVCVLGVCSLARAETFVIDYTGRAQVDPAATFEADCLGASEAPDCATRAALLEAELAEGLAELEGLSDEATQALFTTAVGSGSAAVKELGLRYFSRRRDLPSSLWTSVKEFFFGPDPQIGQPSAEILGFSMDMTDRELSELYLDFRPSNVYDQDPRDRTGEEDERAQACAIDERLDEVPAFAESERFAPASRLLMIDRYLTDLQTGYPMIPASGFVTDAPKAEVIAFFDKLFGKSASPSPASSQAQLQALNAELAALQPKLASGDQDAIKRVQAILDQVSKLSSDVTVGSLLQLGEDDCAECVYWYDGSSSEAYTKPFSRAVVVDAQPQLARTTIRYLGSGGTPISMPIDGGAPSQQSDGGVQADTDAGQPPAPAKKSDGGCSTHGGGANGGWLLALGLLLLTRRRT